MKFPKFYETIRNEAIIMKTKNLLLTLLMFVFGATAAFAQVKRVEMRIGGYLCGN
jgi:hypothetical protein